MAIIPLNSGLRAMDCHFPYETADFKGIEGNCPYEFIEFGVTHRRYRYDFSVWAMDGNFAYEFIVLGHG